jgi:hypothetical protein
MIWATFLGRKGRIALNIMERDKESEKSGFLANLTFRYLKIGLSTYINLV